MEKEDIEYLLESVGFDRDEDQGSRLHEYGYEFQFPGEHNDREHVFADSMGNIYFFTTGVLYYELCGLLHMKTGANLSKYYAPGA